jgi:hypothetical protein
MARKGVLLSTVQMLSHRLPSVRLRYSAALGGPKNVAKETPWPGNGIGGFTTCMAS